MDSADLDRIAALLAAPPPRNVPPELRRAAMRRFAPLLFVVIGGGVAAFGMMFVVGFFPWNFTRQWRLDHGRALAIPGKVVALERTGMSINRRQVMRSTFEFAPPQGSGARRGTCYTTGSDWSVNDTVTIRYLPDDPAIACIEGARLTKTGGMGALILILPGIGASIMAVGLVLRHRTMRMLVHGLATEAQVTSVEPTQTKINNHTVYAIQLKRLDRADAPEIKISKSDPTIVAFVQDRLASKLPVYVLVDPKRPSRALLPEAL